MDSIAQGGVDGIMDWLPFSSGLLTKDMLFPPLSNDLMAADPADPSVGMPCLQAVLFTSWFCMVLTVILLVICRFYPMSELELILDISSITAHLEVLRCHSKSLQKVTVKAFGDYEEGELTPVFQELSELPELKSFSVDLRISFSILSLVVARAKKLQDLSLHFQLRDDGSDGDITTLTKSIHNHPSLTSVMVESSFYDSELDQNLNPLILTLSENSTLRNLSLYNLQCSAKVFSKIFQRSTLQSLELSNIRILTEEQVEILQSNTRLRRLLAPLHRGTEEAWGKLVEINSGLQELMLVVEDGTQQQPSSNWQQGNDPFLAVSRALVANKSLQSLTLDINENLVAHSKSKLGPSLVCMEAIATSLARNSSLKKLRVGHCRESLRQHRSTLQSLVHAVQKNYTLEQLELRTGSFCSRRLDVPEIDFYIRCNQRGRGNVLKRSYRSSLVADFVIQHRSDISIVFHMLLEKPELMQNVYAI